MRLLLITSSSANSIYGGGQVYVKNLIDQLIYRGQPPIIAEPLSEGRHTSEYNGCRVVSFELPLDLENATRILDEVRPDIVHAHGFKAVFAEASKKLGLPCVITAHHGGILCPAGTLLNHRDEICRIKANHKDCLPCVLKNIRAGYYSLPLMRTIPLKARLGIGRLMEKLPFIIYLTPVLKASLDIQAKANEWKAIHDYADLLIAPSDAISVSMIRNGAPKDKVQVISHGIPLPADISENQHPETIKEGTKTKFFYVGRICHVKGIHIMLAAFNMVENGAELHLIGGTGSRSEKRYMRRLQGRYRHDKRIFWHGRVENTGVNKLIKGFDIMIHPAICLEVFGLNIAEALGMGKPVIATRSGGPEMQIVDGVNGILISPNSVSELKNAIKLIANNPLKFHPGRYNVTSINEHVTQLQKIYEEVAH
jgi:glycosyltransferase involved in cell wall biosynthesis